MAEYIEFQDQELLFENQFSEKLIIPIALLGDSQSGKTFVFNKMTDQKQDSFSSKNYEQTYGYQKTIIPKEFNSINGNLKGAVLLYDTAGNYRYQLLTTAHYASFMGVIYVFDIQSQDKAEDIVNKIDAIIDQQTNLIQQNLGKKISLRKFYYPILVICNKFDPQLDLKKAKSKKIKETLEKHKNLIYEVNKIDNGQQQNVFGAMLANFANMTIKAYDEEDLKSLIFDQIEDDGGICSCK